MGILLSIQSHTKQLFESIAAKPRQYFGQQLLEICGPHLAAIKAIVDGKRPIGLALARAQRHLKSLGLLALTTHPHRPLQLQLRIPMATGLAEASQLKQAILPLRQGFTGIDVVKAAVQIRLGLLGRVIIFFPLQWGLAGFDLES